MSIITEYTLAHIKKNRHTSIAIMIAVLLAGTLICSFSMMGQGLWADSVENNIQLYGDWHGELFDILPGEKLPIVENNPHVETVMYKGSPQSVQLPDGSALPYLILRDANADYWANMGEQYAIMEGRIPERPGEIAVTKLFFDRNPQFKLGDTLTLPVGDRVLDGDIIDAMTIRREGETFIRSEEIELTVVGKLDVTTPTAYPGYYSLGFMTRESVKPDDKLTVYMRYHDLYKTYDLTDEIAADVGFQRDEYGDYLVRTNDQVLFYYLADLWQSDDTTFTLMKAALPAMVVLVIILMVLTFVLIIKGVFALSADARARQLGMFRSIGATPAQILRSILLEGLILSVIPLVLSVGLGYAFTQFLVRVYNTLIEGMENASLMTVGFHLPTAVFGVLLTLVVVMLSARGPAKAIAKLSPIESVRSTSGKTQKRKRQKSHPLYKTLFGFTGEFAAESVAARRKSFRSATGAVCLSFVLVGGMLCMMAINEEKNRQNEQLNYYDVDAYLYFVEGRDEELIEDIRAYPAATESKVSSLAACAMMVDESDESVEFAAHGGFAALDPGRYNIADKGDEYRIGATIYGLDDESFARYARNLGVDPAPYLNSDTPRAITQNVFYPNPMARDKAESERTVPLLNIAEGDTVTLLERSYDDINSDYSFDVTVGAVTMESAPEVKGGQLTRTRPVFVLPYSQYDKIVANFLPERASSYRQTHVALLTGYENSLAVEEAVTGIISEYMGSEDFLVSSKEGDRLDAERLNRAMNAMNLGIAGLFALIGVSNAFTAVAAGLRIRRREFAMLRSVGLDDKGVGKLLFIEGLNFSLRPVLLGLPFIVLICWLFIFMTNMTWAVILPVLPYGSILLYALAARLLMGLAYWNGAREIRGAVIVDELRDETA
jgi:putative ABC transport system permease protein